MAVSLTSSLNYADFIRGYYIIMFSMWGLGVDIPRLIVRYGKAYPSSINIHSISMLIIGLFTIMYVVAEIVIFTKQFGSSYSGLMGSAYGQFITSITLASLVLIQFLLGFLTRVEMFKSSLNNYLFTIKAIHMVLGYIIWLLGKVVAILIVNASVQQMLFRGWLFFLAGFAILLIILEVIYRAQSRTVIFPSLFRHKNKHAKYLNEIYQSLLEKKEEFKTYKEKGVRYVIVDNTMYYIDENFMHPGGEVMFTLLNGKEINYYLKGAKALTPQYPFHKHTKYVSKYLESRVVGEIGVDSLVTNQQIVTDFVDWKIVSTIKTNYVGAYLVTFETQAGNVSDDIRIQNFGKYVMMGCSTEEILDKTERPYYFCYSLADCQTAVMEKLRKYYKYYYFGQAINEEEEEKEKEKEKEEPAGSKISKKSSIQGKSSGKLSFFIREVKNGTFTKYLLHAPKERIFSVTGPYGRGLNLNEKSSGYYIFIASDMGVTAFIDFLSFILQKTLYSLIKMKASSPSLRSINSRNTNYEVLEDLKILFVGSFNNSAEFYLNTVIKELYYLNLKHKLRNFNMMLHYANSESEDEIKMIRDIFGKEFLVDLIKEEQPDKVFYSGPLVLEGALRKLEPELKLKTAIEYL